jgi:hypothetical protein
MLGAVDYERIFQSIIRRHPNLLHVSIEECDCNTRSIAVDRTFTLITADAIESMRTEGIYENGNYKNTEIVRRSGTKPKSPYILCFQDKTFTTAGRASTSLRRSPTSTCWVGLIRIFTNISRCDTPIQMFP